MSKLIFCHKLQKEAPALEFTPYPGELGKEIAERISKEAWGLWLAHQTLLINEHRLNLIDKDARHFLTQEMRAFLFGGGSDTPAGYKPPQ